MNLIDLQSGIREKNSYIAELESIRGIAVILVFFFHLYGMTISGAKIKPDSYSLPMSFIAGGNTGVTLFFVLSGFLLSLPFIKGSQRGQLPSVRDYFISRTLRILPLYYIVVVTSIIINGNLDNGIAALSFQYVGFDIFPFSVVWWTLSTEVQFYILLPLVMLLSSTRNGKLILLILLIVWAVAYYLLTLSNYPLDNSYEVIRTKSIFARLPAFIFGIAAAFIYSLNDTKVAKSSKNQRLYSSFALVILVLALGLILQTALSMGAAAEIEWHIHHSFEALCWGLILLLFVSTNPIGKSIFINNMNAFLGKISYSIYLLHVPIMFYIIYPIQQTVGVENYIGSVEVIFASNLSIIATVVASYISYQLIEKPFLKLKQHIPVFRKPTANISTKSN
ncbi:MAG: peptidoglycan/LPS O-acetylase OafA/YrhL [Pseudomonadales bacterium]|jgi:peptidoglycan/LPS O-acetylase OafA/YrhL